MQHASSCLNIMFLYLVSFGQNDFSFQKSKCWKIRILVFGKILRTQKWFKLFNLCVEFFSHIFVFQRSNKSWFLWNLCDFMGFNQRQKDKFLIPKLFVLAVCRSTGLVDRGRSQSTGPVDRRAQDVHTARAGGPIDHGWPSRELCSLEMGPGRSAGRPA